MTTVSGYGGTYANWGGSTGSTVAAVNYAAQKQRRATTRSRKKAARKKPPLTITGKLREYPAYSLQLDFSEDGESYSNPLTDDKPDKVYYIRLQVTQHIGEPMWQGFRLTWTKPSSWAWYDGVGATTYEESISNPIVIVRKVKSPLRRVKVQFKVAVAEKFR